MLSRLVPAVALCVAIASPAASQLPAENMTLANNYRLLQVSVPAATIAPAEFAARTQAIGSCTDARNLARDLDARLTRSRYVGTTNLPRHLLPVLAETKTRRATPVLVGNDHSLHVLVICERS